MESSRPINSQGNKFWKIHFKAFRFISVFIGAFIDLIEDKMKFPSLSLLIAVYYIFGLNAEVVGLYKSQAFCEPLFPTYLSVPTFFLINKSKFSIYSHYFYSLVFIGNLQYSPYFLSLLCAIYCWYDFALNIIDTLFCTTAYNNYEEFSPDLIVYSIFKCALSGLISLCWCCVLALPKKPLKSLTSMFSIGNILNWPITKLLNFRRFSEFQQISATPFEYPLRLKASGTIGLVISIISSLIAIIGAYNVYQIIYYLQLYLDYLDDEELEEFFIQINLRTQYSVNVGTGKEILRFIIAILEPIFPCALVGYIGGLIISSLSVYSMLYTFKKTMLTIRDEGSDSELLRFVWNFKPYHSIFFTAQFIINTVFLCNIFASTLFIICYIFASRLIRDFLLEYLIMRPALFWVGTVPTILGLVYFPLLVDKRNFVKNKVYFSFWDTWYFLIGNFGAFMKAIVRYLLGIGSIVVLGYRAHISIMPPPFDQLDSLYCGFYGTLALQCLKENIIPSQVKRLINDLESN